MSEPGKAGDVISLWNSVVHVFEKVCISGIFGKSLLRKC